MKYKICKMQDGNGKEWYQVKKKGWLFWRWAKYASGPLALPVYLTHHFPTFGHAQKWVDEDRQRHNTRKNANTQKVLECVET